MTDIRPWVNLDWYQAPGYCKGGGTETPYDDGTRKVRCTVCNRRLTPKTILHNAMNPAAGVECYVVPRHRAK